MQHSEATCPQNPVSFNKCIFMMKADSVCVPWACDFLAFLPGVSELDDEMEDLLLPPLEQLQLSLDSLQRLVGQSDNVAAHGTHGGGSVLGQ